jgi:hypothetical protein
MFPVTKTILRKCHTHSRTQFKERKVTYKDYLYTFTVGNMAVFSGINAIYYGYKSLYSINQNKNNKKNNEYGREYDMFDDVFEVTANTYYGLSRGLVLGILWPVTYFVYANRFYYNYKILSNTVINDNDTILP